MYLKRTNPTLYYLQRIGFYVLVVVITLYLLVPFLWAVLTSFRKAGDLFLQPLQFISAPSTLGNYADVFANPNFRLGLLYSLVTAVGAVFIALLFGSFAAYALGRFKFKFK